MKNEQLRFPWDGNAIVAEEYKGKNYVVWDGNRKKKSVLVFFSSNGLYYPDDERTFADTICNKNRYEWKRIGKFLALRRRYSRIIYIRDIYKSWYVRGINSTYNNIDKVAVLLKELTAGYTEIVCCGVSAGGYAASVCGILIGATRVISISGYLDLSEKLILNPLLKEEVKKDSPTMYINVGEMLKGKKVDTKIYYCFSAFSEEDKKQYSYLDSENIVALAFDSDVHGKPMRRRSLIRLLEMDEKKLDILVKKYRNCIIDRDKF